MLSSVDIKEALSSGAIKIEGYLDECLRPSSYLLRLGDTVLIQRRSGEIVDTRCTDTEVLFDRHRIPESGLVIEPGLLCLGSSVERLSLGPGTAAQLSLLSSLARVGLHANLAANLVSATFGLEQASTLTFELINLGSWPIKVYAGAKLCHIMFFRHLSPTDSVYGGIYANASGPLAANFSVRPSR